MTYAQRPAVQRYADVGLQTRVFSANPTQLITLLMDGALAAIRKARIFMRAGNIQARGAAISKAIAIIDSGLKASVKKGQGKIVDDLADNLMTTYDAIVHHLLQANLTVSVQGLDLAEQLLDNIRQAWQEATGAVSATS